MDRPEVYGPVVHTLGFAEAARQGIICDYKVVISVVTSDMVNDHLLKCGEVIVDGDTVKARQVALQIAMQKAVEQYGVSRIFTFHGSVAAASSFTSDGGEGIRSHLPEFTTMHVSGKMRTSLREDHMKIFRQADKAVMSNARCLTEGVDVPAVDMVAFISPRKSKVDIVQATGRAMRKSDKTGKQFGYVMVPLFVEQAENESIEEALQRTGFSDIWDLLGAMREQDDVLVDIIRQMREDKGRTGGYDESQFRERVEVLGPSVSLDTVRKSINAECLDYLGVSWDERFGELLAYKNEHGHVRVPKTGLTALGAWVSLQRVYRKGDGLASNRTERLDEIGFDWDPGQTDWEEKFGELCSYKTRHGHVNVTRNDEASLSTWVGTLRKSNKKGTLSPAKKDRLDGIGFVWDMFDAEWEKMYEELLAYKVQNGSFDIAANLSGLGGWIANQRRTLRRGKLSSKKKKRLDDVGFEWDPLEKAWEENFSELVAYKDEHGDVDVPQHWHSGLGLWLSSQRQALKNEKLPPERKKRLVAIGLKLDLYGKAWEANYNELVAYRAEHGDINVPKNDSLGLNAWVVGQRQNQKKNKLTPDQTKRLEEIGFDWDPLETIWETKFSELVAYKAEHGDIDIKKNDPNGLNSWIVRQRINRKKGILLSGRQKRLHEIGIVWDPLEKAWESKFNEMVAYKTEHGDIRFRCVDKTATSE